MKDILDEVKRKVREEQKIRRFTPEILTNKDIPVTTKRQGVISGERLASKVGTGPYKTAVLVFRDSGARWSMPKNFTSMYQDIKELVADGMMDISKTRLIVRDKDNTLHEADLGEVEMEGAEDIIKLDVGKKGWKRRGKKGRGLMPLRRQESIPLWHSSIAGRAWSLSPQVMWL